MADEVPSSSIAPPHPPDENALSVNVSVISPSLAVNAPLNLVGLPASTTIAQLKEKIRSVLVSKPDNEQQRLIHQGKLLNKENETLLELFGEQKLRASDQVAIHLVIRDHIEHAALSSQTPAATRGLSPVSNPTSRAPTATFALNTQFQSHNNYAHGHQLNHQLPPRLGGSTPAVAHASQPLPGMGHGMLAHGNQTTAQIIGHQQQIIHQYMNQLNPRPAGHHNHPARGSIGSHGPQVQTGNPQFPLGTVQGRNSPHPEYSHVRETVGPNGEIVRIMVNSALVATPNGQMFPLTPQNLPLGNRGLPGPGGPFSTHDVQNIIRSADASQATATMTNGMHRSSSGASLANLNLSSQRQPILAPGLTVAGRLGSTVPSSRTATPDPARSSNFTSNLAPSAIHNFRMSPPNHQPEVYILNSPQGPRALLINHHSDLYYTPMSRYPYPVPQLIPNLASTWLNTQPQPRPGPATGIAQQPARPQPAVAPLQQQVPQQGNNVRMNLFQGLAQQQPVAAPQQAQLRPLAPVAVQLHPAYAEGGLAGALAAAWWPHIWLLVRLAVFVWWFTSPDTSWARWLTIIFVATAVFLINTGLFNGMANNAWNPVRQHLEGLIPLIGPGQDMNHEGNADHAPAAPEQDGRGNNRAPQQGQQPDELDPVQAAARLVALRQQRNADWLLGQIRRLERAGLLFLASIAPGVAERHIAALEAQERAERERRDATERAERERRVSENSVDVQATGSADDDPGSSVGMRSQRFSANGTRENEAQLQQQQQQQPMVAAQEPR